MPHCCPFPWRPSTGRWKWTCCPGGVKTCMWKKRFLVGKTLQHSEECVRCLRNVDRPTGRIDLATQLGSSCSCCVCVVMNFAFRRPCCLTVITHSSIAILLIWLMKPNVFELRAPIISKVAMLGCYRDVVNLCACGCFYFILCKLFLCAKLKALGWKITHVGKYR